MNFHKEWYITLMAKIILYLQKEGDIGSWCFHLFMRFNCSRLWSALYSCSAPRYLHKIQTSMLITFVKFSLRWKPETNFNISNFKLEIIKHYFISIATGSKWRPLYLVLSVKIISYKYVHTFPSLIICCYLLFFMIG